MVKVLQKYKASLNTSPGNRADSFFHSRGRSYCQYSFRLPTAKWLGWAGLCGVTIRLINLFITAHQNTSAGPASLSPNFPAIGLTAQGSLTLGAQNF